MAEIEGTSVHLSDLPIGGVSILALALGEDRDIPWRASQRSAVVLRAQSQMMARPKRLQQMMPRMQPEGWHADRQCTGG